ncbi:MAG: site-specific integrase [Caldilineaceae bacterium]|nr:site-specific integrase [Caldilineaceae bacterium]
MIQTIVQTHANAIMPEVTMEEAGHAANFHAAQHVFDDYLSRKATNTIKSQGFDLSVFADYLAAVGVQATAGDLQRDPQAWQGITWGLVEGFVKWMLAQGFAVGTINRRLSTVKVYAKLAAKAGAIDVQQNALIRLVSGYAGKEAVRVDEKRDRTRVGHKKAVHTSLTAEQAKALKTQPDTPQGRRDAVIMALLLDFGFRVGEVAILEVSHVNLKEGTIQVYRPKVDLHQTHKLSADCLVALRKWFDSGDCAPFGPLLRGSRKGGELTDVGMSTTSISDRVRTLGKAIGVDHLSAHCCRHYWTTNHVRNGKDLNLVRQAGGWKGMAMVLRYAEDAEIANEGLV